jgi:REP element-mobilizing transposase RayT
MGDLRSPGFVMTQRRILQNEFPYSITIRTRNNRLHFDTDKHAEILSAIIFISGKIKQYDIIAYQIMPDHVHVCVYASMMSATTKSCARSPASVSAPTLGVHAPESGIIGQRANAHNISQLVYTIKSYYLKRIRNEMGIIDSIWQRRFHARIVYSSTYFENIIRYYQQNPVQTGLSEKYCRYPYQFINWKYIRGMTL